MNYKKQLFYNYRKLCLDFYEANAPLEPFQLDGHVTVEFIWSKDSKTNFEYETMVIYYHNKPLTQRISHSDIFPTEILYNLARFAEKHGVYLETNS